MITNAIVDALRDYGVRHIEIPATPERVWRTLPAARPLRLLDVGCGNGRCGVFLSRVAAPGIDYTGIDSSPGLLERARERTAPLPGARLE